MSSTLTQTEKVRMACTYILNHPHERISISDLSIQFDINQTTLKKLFRKLFGVTIHQYHLQISMSQAKKKLEGGLPVKNTALQLGYRHIGNFSRAFKKVYGVPPEQYKLNTDEKKS
jgi:AraC-like DNA-binding protein